MQGNAFLGAFFKVSPLLEEFEIDIKQFNEVVHNQYTKKFGRLGDAVVQSNMEVMTQGFDRVTEISLPGSFLHGRFCGAGLQNCEARLKPCTATCAVACRASAGSLRTPNPTGWGCKAEALRHRRVVL